MVLKKYFYLLFLTVLPLCSLIQFEPKAWDAQTPVAQVLKELGERPQSHDLPDEIKGSPIWIKRGEDIVLKGKTKGPDGKKSTYVSKYYVCTSCHNIEQEDPNLMSRDPEARLAYAMEKSMPFLQGTTFHGIVNRESWYNDDYVKKYGAKLEKAHESLREAIQLCAIECSQGRPVEEWEIDAILAYYWTLEFKMGDLDLNSAQMSALGMESTSDKTKAIKFLKAQYLQTSPATFSDAPPDKRKGYGMDGDIEKGKALYELSCLYCHNEDTGVSAYILDDSKMSFKHLKKKIPKDSHFSLYQIIRYGTYALPGHRPYMPHYPLERMSNQQVEDLRAYVELRCE